MPSWVSAKPAGLGKAQAGDTALSLQCEAARQAILEAGLTPADIDAVFAHGTTAPPACSSRSTSALPALRRRRGLAAGRPSHVAHAIAQLKPACATWR